MSVIEHCVKQINKQMNVTREEGSIEAETEEEEKGQKVKVDLQRFL